MRDRKDDVEFLLYCDLIEKGIEPKKSWLNKIVSWLLSLFGVNHAS